MISHWDQFYKYYYCFILRHCVVSFIELASPTCHHSLTGWTLFKTSVLTLPSPQFAHLNISIILRSIYVWDFALRFCIAFLSVRFFTAFFLASERSVLCQLNPFQLANNKGTMTLLIMTVLITYFTYYWFFL